MDWKNLIRALLDSGMTQVSIATAVGASQASVSDLATGRTLDPRHSLGQALLELARGRLQPADLQRLIDAAPQIERRAVRMPPVAGQAATGVAP